MLRSPSWPLAHSLHPPVATAHARRGLPRVAWVLVVSAFLCGAMLSAAVFAAVWRHQAQSKSSADAALAAEQQRSHTLAGSLISAQTAGRRAHREAVAAHAAARTLGRRAATLSAALRSTGRSADTASGAASGVAADLARLTRELRTLTSYIASTPSSQLDAAYVSTQTDFLSQAVTRLSTKSSALETAATAYANAAKAAARSARR